jgi:O-acetyl-ADP-ribose deacetylase (regulator of RNase III)
MLKIIQENIFNIQVDAIVNPANTSLLRGGGLCGLIHKYAGTELEVYCKQLGSQNFGQAVITPSFNLKNCAHIIHACGPRWIDGLRNEEEDLALVHRNILNLTVNNQLKSVALPAISTGIYRFPVNLAAKIAIDTLLTNLHESSLTVYLVLNEQYKLECYKSELDKNRAQD